MSGGGPVTGIGDPKETAKAIDKRLRAQFEDGYKILHARSLMKTYRKRYPHIAKVYDDPALEETPGSVHRGEVERYARY